jgi:2-hydroxychromene-2-carboxylate isomerase
MPKVLEFFFDFMSPPSYLAWTQMPALVARTGCELRYRPMFTIGLHDIVGNQSPVMVPNKAKWIMGDLQRSAREYGVTLKMNPHGLIKILPASRAAALAEREGVLTQLMDVIYPAMFVHGLNLSEVSVVGELLTEAGLDAPRYLEAITTDEVKDLLKRNTVEAGERGAFGAPTFFIGESMHFGQDRLRWVEQDLLA